MNDERGRPNAHPDGSPKNFPTFDIESTDAGPYATAAERYWREGKWGNPIPVRGKSYPVSGYTGFAGRNVTYPDLMAWVTGEEGARNIALRMAGTVGIDVDAHDGESGNLTIKRAQEELGDLPATWSSTSRGQGQPSRIYFYRVPFPREAALARREKAFVERFGANVELLHRAHRYAVVWPSIHPDTGETYRWYAPDGSLSEGVPRKDELPELPAAWLDFLAPENAPTGAPPALTPVYPPEKPFATPSDLLRYETQGAGRKSRSAAERDMEAGVRQFLELTREGSGRTDRLAGLALLAGRGSVAGFWTAERAREGLLEAAQANGYVAAHGQREALLQIDRGMADGACDPWEVVPDPLGEVLIVGEVSSWEPVDMAPVLEGGDVRPTPTLGRRSDGQRLLYPGKEHSISSEPECGKTWWVLLQVLSILAEGGRVVYIDFEDDEYAIGGRLKALGGAAYMTPDRFRYVRPDIRPPAGTIDQLCTFLEGSADLMVLDGVTEGMGLMGLDPLSQKDIVAWRAVAKAAMGIGTAVLSTDHETKSKETRGRYAIGGQHKLAGLNGVMFKMESIRPFSETQGGRSRVIITKDRNGKLRNVTTPDRDGNGHIGDLVLDEGVWQFHPPKQDEGAEEASASGVPERYRNFIAPILAHLTAHPESTANSVVAAVGSKRQAVLEALTWLVDRGQVRTSKGLRNSTLHSVDQYRVAAAS